jgi:methyltransferase (TIGR00027 family)
MLVQKMIKNERSFFISVRRNHSSGTAEAMALFRALESQRPEALRLFTDPYAVYFLRPWLRVLVSLSRLPILGSLVPWLVDRNSPGARPSGVARTRLIDDLLGQALRDGLQQLVILGSGFDCRSMRSPAAELVQVFELDHPDTLRAKRDRLWRRLGSLPSHVRFVEVDFDRQQTRLVLQNAGFDWSRAAFVIWEGVTNYLSEGGVDATLRLVATMAPGTTIVFTYVHLAAVDGSGDFRGMRRLKRRLLRLGEPWTFGFNPPELPWYLEARGLHLIQDIGSVEYRRRYMQARGADLAGYEFYRAAVAEVRQEPNWESEGSAT